MRTHHYNLRPVDAADLDWITDTVVANVRNGAASPAAVFVLLHAYAQRGTAQVQEVLEPLLTDALDAVQRSGDALLRCEWLGAVTQAAVFSDDDRLPALGALLPDVIEGLERAASGIYEPGERPGPAAHAAHFRCANALLTAFDLTGRLPYPMLAEELVQASRGNLFAAAIDGGAGFAADCAAATACTRLALLHRDPDYVARAVVARQAEYAADAKRLLAGLEPRRHAFPEQAAELGRAMLHWLALSAHPI
jgi:hypothetical protein